MANDFSATTTINRPIAEVFAFLSDGENDKKFSARVQEIRKTTDGSRKHRLAMIFFGVALVVIIISIPWPGMPVARPLLRP